MIAVSIATHIGMSEWLEHGDRAIWTAEELLREAADKAKS